MESGDNVYEKPLLEIQITHNSSYKHNNDKLIVYTEV